MPQSMALFICCWMRSVTYAARLTDRSCGQPDRTDCSLIAARGRLQCRHAEPAPCPLNERCVRFLPVRLSKGIRMRTHPRNSPLYAAIPSNTSTACSVYVAIDCVRIARLGFGGVRRQSIERYRENGTEPERARFAQTETEGYSELSFG